MGEYKPGGRAGIVIALLEAIAWLIITPLKWIWKKIKSPGS